MNTTRKLTAEQTVEELAEYLKSNNFPSFRGQTNHGLALEEECGFFEEMKNIGKNLQEFLNSNFIIDKVSLKDQQISKDKTIKCAFEVDKNSVVEGVLIPTKKRMTACISSQVGCSLACTFCATGQEAWVEKSPQQVRFMIKYTI